MPLTLDGTNGVSAVQAGAVESGDLASGAIGSGDLPAGTVIGHAFVSDSTHQVINQDTAINSLDTLTNNEGFQFLTLSYTPIRNSSNSTLIVRGQAYSGEHTNNDAGSIHILWCASQIMGISAYGKQAFSSNSGGPASANYMMQGYFESHTAGNSELIQMRVASHPAETGVQEIDLNVPDFFPNQDGAGEVTSFVEVMEIAK